MRRAKNTDWVMLIGIALFLLSIAIMVKVNHWIYFVRIPEIEQSYHK